MIRSQLRITTLSPLIAIAIAAAALADYGIYVFNGSGYTLTNTIQDASVGGAMYFDSHGHLTADKTYAINKQP